MRAAPVDISVTCEQMPHIIYNLQMVPALPHTQVKLGSPSVRSCAFEFVTLTRFVVCALLVFAFNHFSQIDSCVDGS